MGKFALFAGAGRAAEIYPKFSLRAGFGRTKSYGAKRADEGILAVYLVMLGGDIGDRHVVFSRV
ncbi:hypothetical protein K3180_10925 [Qipengyuania sp. YG19]|nr:hypothetical protein [Qipengyuania huizhouensis]